MGTLIPIQSLTASSLRLLVLDEALGVSPIQSIADLLLSIDWSTVAGDPADEVVGLLAELEALGLELQEDGLDPSEYLARVIRIGTTFKSGPPEAFTSTTPTTEIRTPAPLSV